MLYKSARRKFERQTNVKLDMNLTGAKDRFPMGITFFTADAAAALLMIVVVAVAEHSVPSVRCWVGVDLVRTWPME